MQTSGVYIKWVVGGGPPCKLPIGGGMCKGNDSNPLFTLTTLLSLPMSFVDLGDGLEDSEFEDFEDEFDVNP